MSGAFPQGNIFGTAPLSTDQEVDSLRKINALLLTIATQGGGGTGNGHFDPAGNVQVQDTNTGLWYSLVAPGGILQLVNYP